MHRKTNEMQTKTDTLHKLFAPVTGETFGALALSSFRVTFAPVVADALLSAVWSEPSLRTSLRADQTLQGNCGGWKRQEEQIQNDVRASVWKNWNENNRLVWSLMGSKWRLPVSCTSSKKTLKTHGRFITLVANRESMRPQRWQVAVERALEIGQR